MKIKDRYTAPMEVSHFVERKLDGSEHGSGQLECVTREASNTLAAFARLLEVLHAKNVITLQELGQIVSGCDLGVEAVGRENDAASR